VATLANIDIIRLALRKAQIIPLTATPSAGQADEALKDLNTLMNRMEQDGIRLQYFNQTSPADDFPCPEYTHQGVIGMLAMSLCANFGRSVPAELSNGAGTGYADVGMQTIMRKAMNDQLPRADMSHLPQGSGRRRGWDNRGVL
jgi:hypothetical protein